LARLDSTTAVTAVGLKPDGTFCRPMLIDNNPTSASTFSTIIKTLAFDPGNQSQIPMYRYHTVYSYNSEFVDPNDPLIGSWKLLFEGPEKYRNKITMLDNHFHVIGSALKYLGYSFNSVNEEELKQAKELLLKHRHHQCQSPCQKHHPRITENLST